MLNSYQLTMTEAVYLAIDSHNLSESYCYELIDHFRIKNKEAYKYLWWLLNRWTLLRLSKYHLPKRITYNICLNNVVNNLST
jgi:hypothetical protein